MYKTAKRIISCILALVMTFSASLPVYAQSAALPDTNNIKNQYVEYFVNSKNGGFVIKTVEGSMLRKSDENKHILFQGDNYDTSFTTFRIGGKDYIFGNGYGFLGMGGSFVSQPRNIGASANSATWRIGDIEITQVLELINDKSNPNLGNVKITYSAANKGKTDVSIGARMLLDTMLDNNDGAPFELGDTSLTKVTTEKRLAGSEIPQYWKSMDNLALPNVVSYGFTSGWGNRKPDEMIIGHWNNLAATKWDYTTDPTIDFTRTDSKYGTADSAMAMYWKPSVLKAGASATFETHYGIMAQNLADQTAGFAVNAYAEEKKLSVDSTGKAYKNSGIFEITAEVDNSITGSADLTNVVATLQLEDGLQLAEGEVRSKFVQGLAKGGNAGFTWKVKAAAQSKYSIKQFKVDVQPEGYAEPVSAGDYILLPGLVQTQPKILFSSISPEKLYYQGMKYINIKGSGLEYYSDKGSWEMYIVNMNGIKTAIPDENITIVDKTQMTVRIDGDFALGEYGIAVEWSGGSMPQGTVQTLPVRIAMTDNPKDRNDYYGILCIVRNGNNYDLNTFKDENELASHIAVHGKDSIMLELRGYLTKLVGSDNSYLGDTSLDPVIINNIVVYRGQPMSIKKENGKVTISGDGPLQVIGALTFWKWGFEITLQDGNDYSLDREPASGQERLQISLTGLGSMIQAIGGFTMDLKYGVFQREQKDGAYYNQISFGGKMSLPVFPGDKSKEEGSGGGSGGNTGEDDGGMPELGGFSVDMRDVLFGERKDKEQGFIGIDTTLGIEIPDNAFGGVIENGFEAELTINTINHIYGVSFAADIMVLECEGTLTIRLHEGKYPVPDELRFVGGGDPGIPVVPGILYVTKLGGGYSKLYESIFGDAWLPPITLHLTAGASLFALLELETNQEISLSGYSMDGSASLRGIPVLDNFSLSLSWVDPIYAQVAATIRLYAIIKGTASIYISPDYLEGWARVVIEIPESIPFIGGEVLAGAEVGISTVKVWGKIIILGLGMGVAYYWSDESVEFITRDQEQPLPGGRYAYAKLLEGEDGQRYSMLVGTNTHLLASSKNGYRSGSTELCMAGNTMGYFKDGILLAANTITNEYQVTIPAGQKAAYLQVQYYGERPSLEIHKPDGSKYELVEHITDAEGHTVVDGNFKWQEMATGEKYAFISLVGMDSIEGNWTIKSSDPIDITLMGVDPLPELKGVTFTDIDTVQKKVGWTIENPGGAAANIYIAKSADDPGVLAAKDIDAASRETIINVPDTLQSGDYYIRVTAKKGDSYFESKLSENSFSYTNTNQPGRVEAISVLPIGNGCFKIDVTDTQDNIDGYIIEAFDNTEKRYEGFTPQYFKKDDEITAGGWIPTEVLDDVDGNGIYDDKDSNGNQITKEVYKGLEPGKAYIISAAPCRKIGDKTYLGEAVMSGPVLLPAPSPANITLDCDESFKAIQGEAIKITNNNTGVFSFTSDQEVTSSIKLDGLEIGSPRSGREWSVTVPAEDGSHLLRVVSKNEKGDASEASILYTVDTAAPQLFVESPRSGDIYTGGRLDVKGIFEKGAKYTVSIDGEAIYKDSSLSTVIEDGGSIDMKIDMSGKTGKLVHDFEIIASDEAGNTTVYEASVIDGSAEMPTKVHIREKTAGAKSLDGVELEIGDKQSFKLVGVDSGGNETELNNAQISWRVLSGPAMAYVSEDGEVNALLPGEAVILGSYELEESYSLEDALIVRVKPEAIIPPDDDDDNDDDYDDNDEEEDDDDDGGYRYSYPAGQVLITGTGKIAASVFSSGMLQSLIDKAAANEEGKKVITISIPAVPGAGGYSAGIPIPYIAGASGNVEFRIVTSLGTITIPGNMLQGASWLKDGNYGKDRLIYLSITSVDTASLPARLQGQIDRHPVIDLSLSLDGKVVRWNNPDVPVTVSTPYVPSQEEAKAHENITVWYIDEEGNAVPVPSGRYDPVKGRVSFTTTHFSSYAVVFVKSSFKDTSDTPWAQKQIEILASKGVLREAEKNLYLPKKNITRADFLYSLVRALGLEASFKGNFSDVQKGKYYYKELGTAKKLGITEGVGNNKYNPEDLLTRQDMMTLTARALEKLGKLKPAVDSAILDSFSDKGDISAYAENRVSVMVKEGLIVGSGGRISPKSNTTRAETAVLLYRIYNKY